MTRSRIFNINQIPKTIKYLIGLQARGVYQEALLNGEESWSGSTLRNGKGIREYCSRYTKSRKSLVERINKLVQVQGWQGARLANLFRHSETVAENEVRLVLTASSGFEYVWEEGRFSYTMKNEVVVGNVGTVYLGDDCLKAHRTYLEYLKVSQQGSGRAGGESVTWIRDSEVYAEYEGGNEASN